MVRRGGGGAWEKPKRYRAGRSAKAARIAIAVHSTVGRKQREHKKEEEEEEETAATGDAAPPMSFVCWPAPPSWAPSSPCSSPSDEESMGGGEEV